MSFFGQLSEPIIRIEETESGILINNNFQATANDLAKSEIMHALRSFGPLQYPYPLTAVEVELVSDNVNDTLLGTGAREVTVFALGVDYISLAPLVVSMNGTTPVVLPTNIFRANKLFLTDAPIRGKNEGQITLRTTGTGDILSTMMPNKGQSFDGVLSTSDTDEILIYLIDITAGKGDSGSVAFFRSTNGSPMVQRTADIFFYQNNFMRPFVGPIGVPSKSDIQLRARIANNNTKLTVTSQLIAVP